MAPILNQEIGLRRESDQGISPPAVLPAHLESPFSAALPLTVAGRQRATPSGAGLPLTGLRGLWRLDWFELSTIGLAAACAVLSVYRLFWAIQI